jgi:hypothetical protein
LTASTGLGNADNKGYINGAGANAIDQNFPSIQVMMILMMMMMMIQLSMTLLQISIVLINTSLYETCSCLVTFALSIVA